MNFSGDVCPHLECKLKLNAEMLVGEVVENWAPSASVDVVGVRECPDPMSERGCCRTEIGLVSCSRVAGDVVLWCILESPCT